MGCPYGHQTMVSIRYLGGRRRSEFNLTSLYKKELTQVRLQKVNGEELKRQASDDSYNNIEHLPFLGRIDESPFLRGWSHIVVAYTKTGKTELVTRVASEWGQLGVGVLYISEEHQGIWRERMSRIEEPVGHIDVVFALGGNPEEINSLIIADKAEAVVVDTARLLGIADENDNPLIHRTLAPLIAACRESGKTLVLVHHTRKAGGSYGEGVSGGHAFSAIVDVVIEIERYKGVSNTRKLSGLGRLIGIPDVLYEMGEGGVMRLLGDPKEVTLETVKERIIEAMTEQWVTLTEIRSQSIDPIPSKGQLSAALNGLASGGLIERDPPMEAGQRPGVTYRWRVKT